MDLQCILCIVNSSYAVKTLKDEVTCNTYWNLYKKLKNLDMFPPKWEILRSNKRTGDNLSKQESPVQNRRVGIYCMCLYMYVHIHVYIYMCVCVCMFICMSIYICVYIYILYIYACIYIYMYLHVCIYACVRTQQI